MADRVEAWLTARDSQRVQRAGESIETRAIIAWAIVNVGTNPEPANYRVYPVVITNGHAEIVTDSYHLVDADYYGRLETDKAPPL